MMSFFRAIPERRLQFQHLLWKTLSRRVDAGDIKSVCLALGPYRNLTTLTAAMVSLHPNCQVLNHAGDRIFADPKLNFFRDYSDEKFEAFVRYAIYIANGGRGTRGQTGGSILHSHAFQRSAMRQAYAERFGTEARKAKVECLFWKESLRTSNLIRQTGVDMGDIFRRNAKLRFLMPIRNPIDCAYSNLKTGHTRFLQGLSDKPRVEEVVAAVVRELAWFFDMRDAHPDRCFYYFEDGFDDGTAQAIAQFLEVKPDSAWIQSARSAYQLERRDYAYQPELMELYADVVTRAFAKRPQVAARLLALASTK
jgi:hypothetical protein